MPISGRLTARTADAASSAILAVRGVGLGCSVMPATAAAYASVSRAAVTQATTVINVLQRVGGSIGTALLAVVLEDQIRATAPRALIGGSVEPLPKATLAHFAAPLAQAFSHTFWWAVALTAAAVVPAIVLAVKAPRRPLRARGVPLRDEAYGGGPPPR